MTPDRSRHGEQVLSYPVELEEVNVAEGNIILLKMTHATLGAELVVALHQADFIQLADAIEHIRQCSPHMFVLEEGHPKWGKHSFDQERN